MCEQAEALLQPFLHGGHFHLQVIEISHDEALVSRYGLRIPVLVCTDGEKRQELGWPFDQAQVWSWWSQASLMCQGS